MKLTQDTENFDLSFVTFRESFSIYCFSFSFKLD